MAIARPRRETIGFIEACARLTCLLLPGLYVPAMRATAELELSRSYSPAAALHLDSALEAVASRRPQRI